MNKSLSTFMMIAAIAVILSILVSSTYNSLFNKNDDHQEIIEDNYNLKIKT